MKKFILISIAILLVGLGIRYYIFSNDSGIPGSKPNVTVKSNGKKITSKVGEHNWFDSKTGGNSCLVGPSVALGKSIEPKVLKPEDKVTIDFATPPKTMKIIKWSLKDEKHSETTDFTSDSKYSFTLPKEKGDYVFEVVGNFDETHNTSDVFRVLVE